MSIHYLPPDVEMSLRNHVKSEALKSVGEYKLSLTKMSNKQLIKEMNSLRHYHGIGRHYKKIKQII